MPHSEPDGRVQPSSHPGGSQLLLRSFDEHGVDYLLDAFIVDLLLNANGQSFDTLSRYAQTIDLDGIRVKTVSLESLLLTKRTI